MKFKIFLISILGFLFTDLQTTLARPSVNVNRYIVMDFYTGEILSERGAWTLQNTASMTKTLTAFIVFQEIEAGNLTMDTMLRVSPNASRLSTSPDLQGIPTHMPANSYVSVRTLLELIMLPSSNGATVVVAEYLEGSDTAFAQRMNRVSEELGIRTNYLNSHGASGGNAHNSDVYSQAMLIREFIKRYPEILEITRMPYMYYNGRRINSTNLLLQNAHRYVYADGFKTGVTRESGWGHSTTAYKDGRRIIAVLFGAGSNDGRHTESIRLLNWGFAEADRQGLPLPAQLTPLEILLQNDMINLREFFDLIGVYMSVQTILDGKNEDLEITIVIFEIDGVLHRIEQFMPFVFNANTYPDGILKELGSTVEVIYGNVYVPRDFVYLFLQYEQDSELGLNE
ncbi:MAG: serine hydrolase [Defluviitaleaceae bacterium]|nr:serine hydrolase [Defluviitaleaceae bacterium]